eukprot:CAMPEP_0201554564 /NCGR_PEP_ID=MMETSP0173_2-20130828/42334_1 /ASSEMBLY_ACC=CAM_ASM_000268 /TAXON_ID=218659 /ORGANISM="Vexillifera sp., Strain DIVA3 564/2" /LENGTH=186 /DNA_ID=CAMNT_0047965911 /DNA_START=414 /DNA_END=971 /DNA_ORIENTATION=+
MASFGLLAAFDYDDKVVEIFGQVLGIVSALATIVQWSPQIYTVYVKKGPGSLSLLMLLLQAPGALACAIFQGLFYQENWTTWVSYACMFLQETVIIIQLVYYYCTDRKRYEARSYSELATNDDAELADLAGAHLLSEDGQPISSNDSDLDFLDDFKDDDLYQDVFGGSDDDNQLYAVNPSNGFSDD